MSLGKLSEVNEVNELAEVDEVAEADEVAGSATEWESGEVVEGGARKSSWPRPARSAHAGMHASIVELDEPP